jgi:hypothetical protein
MSTIAPFVSNNSQAASNERSNNDNTGTGTPKPNGGGPCWIIPVVLLVLGICLVGHRYLIADEDTAEEAMDLIEMTTRGGNIEIEEIETFAMLDNTVAYLIDVENVDATFVKNLIDCIGKLPEAKSPFYTKSDYQLAREFLMDPSVRLSLLHQEAARKVFAHCKNMYDKFKRLIKKEENPFLDVRNLVLYLYDNDSLPDCYVDNQYAFDNGWVPHMRNLHKIFPGKMLGGKTFHNLGNPLPQNPSKTRTFQECDINYINGKRGEDRLVFSNDGQFWLTDDHYETFSRVDIRELVRMRDATRGKTLSESVLSKSDAKRLEALSTTLFGGGAPALQNINGRQTKKTNNGNARNNNANSY